MRLTILILCCFVVFLSSCSRQESSSNIADSAQASDKYPLLLTPDHDLEHIRKRVKSVVVGMPEQHVLFLLGKPAEVYPDKWVYRNPEINVNKANDTIVIYFADSKVTEVEQAPAFYGIGASPPE